MVAREGKDKWEGSEKREEGGRRAQDGEEGRGIGKKAEEWERECPTAGTPPPPSSLVSTPQSGQF